jgi:1-acyl-sn-glycerol-3-phosphate acyltransferase
VDRIDKAHRYAREKGVSRPLYGLVRALVTPLLRFWIRLHVKGREHVPAEGPAILAPNHKSLADPFFVGLSLKRHVRFMAKAELFRGPLGRLLPRLGAFPVRRGQADAEALETARTLLRQGELVVVFPEGTRVGDPDVLGSPHHGAGRLAIDTGAPIVPAAIEGTSKLWLGPVPKPRRIQVSFLEPVRGGDQNTLIDHEVWPAVQSEYGRLAATPGLIAVVLTALGIGGGLVARRQRKAAPPKLLGVVEPLKIRRRKRRARALDRLRRR